MSATDDEFAQGWSRLAAVDVELLLSTGVPRDAISEDGVLNVELLKDRGWTVTGDSIEPPDEDEYHALADEIADRTVERGDVRRGYK